MEPSRKSAESENEREFVLLLSYFFLQNNRPEKAAVLLKAYDVLKTDDPEILSMWACAALRSEKPAEALDLLNRLAAIGKMDSSFHLMRGQALAKLKRMDEASSAMRFYIKARQQESANKPTNTTPF